MKCPTCLIELSKKEYNGIEVDECIKCGGMWFEAQEVDQLEDTVLNQDEFKNTMITHVRDSEKNCPKCEQRMKKFNYRWEDLELDYCAKSDGYWLDKGEEKRITEIITQQANDLDRKFRIEEQWSNNLKGLQSPSIISKIRNLIGL
ncbi:hypothetical protein A2334_03470 [Candidatus Roizmanbacteria bacterium RIFOXYB2_FULL_38_10]|uniref:Transcription factor zinc-finger domain-containing protein n=1 Tax=Candidatus Roizmanbacteria bacterium RIFOXYD1_FULL_38_12 TaxID=1802093 RepID=A0A1F7L0Z3_9BACT|nr:MAG: hypothetical protein A3K47_03375 [Candidatus Roizmanbacteria bacterium RIFOXYA2_FULL_38_14]OGK63804.1 MAG: hypothetical protein A3K27_03375 [Candidatus Roizmanbacteria bacterium RIFOXYA1_FULL_37_12]OGK65650.1 MAG: hypothetical protein A3K38_03375 [Candidatus Roizmanbacteria bacterium RIFOXYB1_FULL_40_23]OGK67462.1 MAG: hypothetical protein A2334_03470 [Candidatus Roizmanbacteria bacterium RIFOXYB2_FULL_38_10]OGK70055.1 MAG: hypothetical protein A3K21_03380 [Candidatus Roizmanbacteria ba